jgi:toxin YoeB
MRILFTREAWAGSVRWQEEGGEAVDRINRLIADVRRSPFNGLGKPEPLRRDLSGWWSRRIASDHRLVYRVLGTGEEQQIEIVSCRYHYSRRG